MDYDPANGNLTRLTDVLGNETRMTYNARGQIASIPNVALNQTTTLSDNEAGDLIVIRDPLGNESRMAVDALGRTTGSVDSRGFETKSEYDTIDQLTRMTDANLGITQLNVDGRRDLRAVVNPLGQPIESYEYDPLHRLTKRIDALLKEETYGYDANGNLITVRDRKGQQHTFSYDERDQVIQSDFAGATQTRRFDAQGRLIEVREADSGVQIEYDTVNRPIRFITDAPGVRSELIAEFDALDRRIKRTVLVNGQLTEETSFGYDDANRLISQTHRAPGVGQSIAQTIT
ncbi:MAG: hypothetical protein ACKVQU_11555 [Burkholderiales bacterium]